NPVTGLFTWTPSEAQGPGTNVVTIRVSDNGTPALSAFETITIVVSEVNSAPVLTSIVNKTVKEGSPLVFAAIASDADIPAQTLVYSLDNGAPEGASINPVTGLFTWTPTESQGPSTNLITIRVTDNGSPAANASQTFTIIVTDVNSAPVLPLISTMTIDEGSLLSINAAAIDADLPLQVLTYSLGAGAPVGAAINPTNGLFTWTPTEAQGPSTNLITIHVTDNGLPALSDSETFTIVVNEVNSDPVLAPIGNKIVAEGNLISFTVLGTDSDIPLQTLSYSLDAGAPAGATINPTNGLFTWTPTEAQGPSTNTLTIRVSDNGSPALQGSRTFTITVYELNTPPVLSPILDKVVAERNLLTFVAPALDPDLPAQDLIFSLEPGAPAGAAINPVSGVFTWTPSNAQGPSTNLITIRVTDNGTPPATASQTFRVVVTEENTAPVLVPIGNKAVSEDSVLSFTVVASDSDVPMQNLTFTLETGAPAGAAIDPTTGVFTWKPSNSQGPSTNFITIRVADNGSPSLAAVETIQVIVTDLNTEPHLAPVLNQTVAEGDLLTFTATASDGDLPAQTLTFSLAPGAPAGASIDPITGIFAWTPSESQGPSTNLITIVVMDDGMVPLSDSKSFVVVVTEVNSAPVLGIIPDQTIPEGAPFTFAAVASDSDLPAQKLAFTLGPGAPIGSSIDPDTGVFTWTPTELQGPSTNLVTIRVTDSWTPAATVSQTFTIVVLEVNTAPLLTPIPTKAVGAGTLLTFQVTATDSDLPAQNLTFGLGGDSPAGAAIDPVTGLFTWMPSPGQADTTNLISIVVTDSGTPNLSAMLTVRILVVDMPNLTLSGSASAGSIALGSNVVYHLAVSNQGPSTAFAVFLTNYLTAEASLVSSVPDVAETPTTGTVVFDLGDMAVGAVTNISLTVTYSDAGTFTAFARVGANKMDVDVDDNEISLVTAVVDRPPIAIANLVDNSVILAPTNVVLTASVMDVVDAVKVEYFSGSLKIGQALTPPFAFTWLNPHQGKHKLTAKVTRKNGHTESSRQITVDVVPALFISDARILEGNIGNLQARFAVRLSAVATQTVLVDFSTSDGTAWAGWDYVPVSGTLIFKPGVVSQVISVPVIGDLLSEYTNSFMVNLNNPVNAGIADPQGIGYILDNDRVPGLYVNDVVVSEGDEGIQTTAFLVHLSAPSERTVTVNFATMNGTATAGFDFVPTNGVLTFLPGVVNQTVPVAIFSDKLNEVNETFSLVLSKSVNAIIRDAQGICTIMDNDPAPSITIGDATVTEGTGGFTSAFFNVSLSAPSGRPISVRYATANGSALAGRDYVAVAGALTFAPGVTSTNIRVSITGDTLSESNETFVVNLAAPVNANIARAQGVGTIIDNDPVVSLSINDVTVTEGNGAFVYATFTVRLSALSGQTVLVDYVTSDGTAQAGKDYIFTNGTVAFPPGTVARTITVPVVGDALSESNEFFFVNLLNPVNAHMSDSQGKATIRDTDPAPSLSINDVSVVEGDDGSAQAVFSVRLSARSSKPVTVSYATANGTALASLDYNATNGVVTFQPGETNQTISIMVLGDTLNEANETFFVNLNQAVNATIADGQGMGTILDDDAAPTITISNAAVAESSSGVTNADFNVTLSAPSGKSITVHFATTNGSAIAGADYVAAAGTLTFAPGVTSTNIHVSVRSDTLVESDEFFLVNLTLPVNAALANSQGIGTILGANIQGASAKSLSDLKITSIKVSGANVLVAFPSLKGKIYCLDYTDKLAGAATKWIPAGANVAGTGESIAVTHSDGAMRSSCIYRIRVVE
ncbi:MAG: N-acetylmuramoyl-L-alanine amidase, partial [Verrucomicrobiales bacterium]|nr:N-acetylmuramoyl-L-alanine amidase [Verrucomicrobiales bacterium]